MKVMSFNVRVDFPADGIYRWNNRFDKVSQLIKEEEVSIIGMQEVLPSMLNDLERDLPTWGWIGERRSRKKRDEYCPLFFKKDQLKLIQQETFWLSDWPYTIGSKSWDTNCPRVCTWGSFCYKKIPDKQFIVYNTHLDHISDEARLKGLNLIHKKMMEIYTETKLPFILMGDFNDTPDSESVKSLDSQEGGHPPLKNAYSIIWDRNKKVGATFHGFGKNEQKEPIDYIFTSSKVHIMNTFVLRKRINHIFPSDHYPVVSEVEF